MTSDFNISILSTQVSDTGPVVIWSYFLDKCASV